MNNVIDSSIEKILRFYTEQGIDYYVYGGKALNKISPNIISKDWDIVISGKDLDYCIHTINQILGRIKIELLSLTDEFTGSYNKIYRISYKNEDIIDFLIVQDINKSDIVLINGIKYLDISLLVYNIINTIKQSESRIYEYIHAQKRKKNLIRVIKDLSENSNERSRLYLKNKTKISILKISLKDLNKYLEDNKPNYTMAQKIYEKNKIRLKVLNYIFESTDTIDKTYKEYLCSVCNNDIDPKDDPIKYILCGKIQCNK